MATRSKYNLVKQEEQKEDKPDTDILMRFCPTYGTSIPYSGRYVTRALSLFFGEGKNFVTIKAADRLIDRALWVAEVVKRRVQGLHQIIEIKEREVVDVYEPKEEGLLRVEKKRYLTIIEVTLTKEPTAEQKKMPGYQTPTESKEAEYLTKEKWAEQEAERKDRADKRGEREEDDKGERKERGERRERGDGERGGERRRGRNNDRR